MTEYFSVPPFLFGLMFKKHPTTRCHRAYVKSYPASYENRYFSGTTYPSLRDTNKRIVVEHALIHGNCVVRITPFSDTVELILSAK